MMQAEMAAIRHECMNPNKKSTGQISFTVDENAQNRRVARLRILIENAFKRVREWKIMAKCIKVTLGHPVLPSLIYPVGGLRHCRPDLFLVHEHVQFLWTFEP